MKDPSTSSPSKQANSGMLRNGQNMGDDAGITRTASEQQHAHIKDKGVYLSSLSEWAGRSFASTTEALEAVLKLIVDQLGLRSSFITRISRDKCQNAVLIAYNAPGGSDIPTEALMELSQTF